MNTFTFDTETTGIPIKLNDQDTDYKLTDYYNEARMIQIAWCVTDVKDTIVKKENHFIKPKDKDGKLIKIMNSHIHGITDDICEIKGIDIKDILPKLLQDLKGIRLIIGHNVIFDLNILKSELCRIKDETLVNDCQKIISELNRIENFDTMRMASIIYKFYKWPKLTELHKFLIGSEFDGAHDAMNDVIAAQRCFLKMTFGTDLRIE